MSKLRIVVVDDEPIIRMDLDAMLKDAGAVIDRKSVV